MKVKIEGDIDLEVGWCPIIDYIKSCFKESDLNVRWEDIEDFWLGGYKLELQYTVIIAAFRGWHCNEEIQFEI